MPGPSRDKIQLPMIRLNLVKPFLDSAHATVGVGIEAILRRHGVSIASFANPDQFLPAPTMYDLVEVLSEATRDPYIGAHLGTQLDPFAWGPLASAASEAHSVGDLLLRFSIDAYRDANSVLFRLETKGTRTTFGEERLTDGGRMPRHNDGFGVAYIVSILKSALGRHWVGKEVLATVCDPAVFPGNFFDILIARGDTNGFSVAFPCQWLLLEPQLAPPQQPEFNGASTANTPSDMLTALRHILDAHLHEAGLDGERIAHLCGVSKRTLYRRLYELDTSLKREMDQLRLKKASAALATGDKSVASIGASLGYPDPSVFTRTFRRWTGKSPREFRQSESTQEH